MTAVGSYQSAAGERPRGGARGGAEGNMALCLAPLHAIAVSCARFGFLNFFAMSHAPVLAPRSV